MEMGGGDGVLLWSNVQMRWCIVYHTAHNSMQYSC